MKYEIIQTTSPTVFAVDCPIQLVKSMVTQDIEKGIYYLNVQYFSMVKTPIENICLRLSVKEDKSPIKTVSSYIFAPTAGVGVMKNDKPFAFFIGVFKDVEICVTRITFCDGSVWRGGVKQLFCESPEKLNIQEYKKYDNQISEKFAYIKTLKYAYSENKYLWRCPCGCVNKEDTCFICGSIKEDTRNFFDIERLERQDGWIKEKLACDKEKEANIAAIEKSAQLSGVLDSVIVKTKSERSCEVAEAIVTINSIYNEDLFYKKAQADELLARAKARFAARKKAEVEYKNMMAHEAFLLADSKRIKKQRAQKRDKILAITTSTLLCLCILCFSVFYGMTEFVIPSWKYESALSSFNSGAYTEAIAKFEEMEGYGDSENKIVESKYLMAVDYIEGGDYISARTIFQALGDYEESAEYVTQTIKMEGVDYMSDSDYYAALDIFATIPDYDGISILQDECYYRLAVIANNSGDDDGALELFYLANDYANSDDFILSIISGKAYTYFAAGNYSKLIQLLEFADYDFVADYMSVVVPAYEETAREYYDAGEYYIAKEMYTILANSTKWLAEAAANRVVAYPVFCDARLYGNNYDAVVEVFELSYESYNIIQDVEGYMVKFLSDSKWVSYTFVTDGDDSVSTRNMTVDASGYAELSLQNSTIVKGTLTYINGYLYVDGKKIVEVKVSSYTGIAFNISDAWYSYARTSN